jgi:phospholipase C
LTGPGLCGTAAPGAFQDRCGFGPRQPLLVISPFARRNFVDHATTGQASILRFIEDNWSLGRSGNQSFEARDASLSNLFDFDASHRERHTARLVLDPATGQEVR